MKLAVLFHRLGPYHHARLCALARHCALTGIEFSSIDNTYAWDTIKGEGRYPVITLFTDTDCALKPIHEITRQITRVLGTLRPDLVAIPGWSSPAALAAVTWCCSTNTPAILMSDSGEHDERRTWWKEWPKSRVVKLFSSALVAGKPHVDYASKLGLPRKFIFSGYDVVDNDYYSTQSDQARTTAASLRFQFGLPKNYFLASSRFIEKKNIVRLLQAYAAYIARTGEHAWHLVLLGDGPLKPTITDQIVFLGLGSRIIMPGFKQYDELPVYYGLAHAFVHASTSEQWGLVVNEAMASGLPVLVSERCGCAPDLVKNGVNGFTFDPYDVEEVTRRMLEISHGECDLVAMGQASRDIIRDWSPETFAVNMLKAAQTAIDAPRPKAGWLHRALLYVLERR